MGLNDAVQALKRAEILKEKVESHNDLLSDGDAWIWQQQLQRIYQQVLLQDLEFALDCKVEQELWNYGFKNYICMLQNMVKDRKNLKRNESQAMLTWCLEAASGFYLTLLQEICTAFDLDLSCRRRDSVYGIVETHSVAPKRIIQPNSTSCSYICQHCLVHLGDIARYRNQNRQAESFYKHAVQLSPTSGQPYNQLAILDSSRGDRLGTVFHYVRSVTVRHLFPAAATNLKRMFSKCAEDQVNVEGRVKLNMQDYVALFLKLHGLLYLGGDLTTCSRSIRLLTDTLTAQVATENFTSRKLVQMLVINLFALHRARGNFLLPENDKFLENQEMSAHKLTPEQKQARELILDLMAGSLSALLLPVYTIRDNKALLEYFALPAIKLTLDWIQLEPHVLADQAFTSRLQIWPSLCKLLNGLQSVMCESDHSNKFSSIPLPEDKELHGFLPLDKTLRDLRFNCEDVKLDSADINKIRAARLLHFGIWLFKHERGALISARGPQDSGADVRSGAWVFEAVASGQAPSNELLRELEQLSLGAGQCPPQPSPSPSDAGSWGGSSASTPGGAVSPPLQPVILEQMIQIPEKRTGILKPQGSLEKSRGKDIIEVDDGRNTFGQGRKGGRQNVAMQTILRKGVSLAPETDAKQVSFKTPSPTTDRIESQNTQWKMSWPKPVQPQPVVPQQVPRAPLPAMSPVFSQPPPPMQQPQQQLHILPAPPAVSVPNDSVQRHPSFALWDEEPSVPDLISDGTHRNSVWWPAAPDQFPPSHNPRIPIQNYPANWGPLHSSLHTQSQRSPPQQRQQQFPLQSQQQQFVIQPHRFQQSSLQRHNNGPQMQQESHMHPVMFPSAVGFQHQLQRPTSDEKRTEYSGSVEGFSPYSLFSTNNWLSPTVSPGITTLCPSGKDEAEVIRSEPDQAGSVMGSQSLWSGPGPSPLERLLEQQKQLREGPSPKSGT